MINQPIHHVENKLNVQRYKKKYKVVIQLDIVLITLLEIYFPHESFSTIKEIMTGGR